MGLFQSKLPKHKIDFEKRTATLEYFYFTLCFSDREEIKDFINKFQDKYKCQITSYHINRIKDNLYRLNSVTFDPHVYKKCTGISSSRYRHLEQVQIVNFFHANYGVLQLA